MVEKVPNWYKVTDVDNSTFLLKFFQFDSIWILSVKRIIMWQCKILIAQLQVGLNLLDFMLLCPMFHI